MSKAIFYHGKEGPVKGTSVMHTKTHRCRMCLEPITDANASMGALDLCEPCWEELNQDNIPDDHSDADMGL